MADDVFELVGTQVAGTFAVEKVIAEGGFAVVYRAIHQAFKAPVALKCLKIPQSLSAEAQASFKEQFRAEAELLFKLSARLPNVVRPLHVDAITAPNGRFMPFLALEWLDGETLDAMAARRFEEGRDMGSLEELVTLLTPIAEALDSAHHFDAPGGAVSIVHRDIKPENLFVASVGGRQMVKILDFGIGKAKSVASQIAGKASTDGGSQQSFTPAFAAPEQWVPKRFGQTGPWTDVFGLALTTVELFVGHPILDGDQGAMMGAALDPFRRPTPCNEGRPVTPRVEAAFTKALAVDPRERTQTVGEFWRELRSGLDLQVLSGTLSGGDGSPNAPKRRHPHDELDLGSSPPPDALELASIPPREGLMVDGEPLPTPRAPQWPASVHPKPRQDQGSDGDTVIDADQWQPLPRMTVRPAPSAGWRDLVVPGTAIVCGLLLAILGQQYASTSGRVFTFGSVGLGWITTPMVVLGGAVGFARLLQRRYR